MPLPSVVVWVAPRAGTLVLRQNRSWPSVPSTVMSVVQQLTANIVPVSAFSGRPPSPGGLNRGSRQVPVQIGLLFASTAGSSLAPASVSLYETRVRYGVPLPSMLFSHRVFQNTSLPLKNPRLTPASRAASTRVRCPPDQY